VEAIPPLRPASASRSQVAFRLLGGSALPGLGLGVLGVGLLTRAEIVITTSSLLGLAAVLLASASWAAGVAISPRVRLPEDALGARRFRCFVAR
jgi:drug/metabolite transporter (DMT)-like permease